MTDSDILLAAVRAQTRALKLPTVGRESDALARQALAEAWAPLQYLRTLLDAELAIRAEHAVARRLQAARLPAQKTLANSTGDALTDSSARRRLTDEVAHQAAMLATMGCGEAWPVGPGLERDDWSLDDPKGKPLGEVRATRDEIERRVLRLMTERDWARA